nr:uncharacterized protein LOC112211365 [Halyomorpha halys]
MCRVLFLVVILVVGGRAVWASNTSTSIWDTLMGECSTASFRCVQDSLHRSLEDSLSADFVVTDSIVFRRNENKYSQEANTVKKDEMEPDEEFDEWVNSVEDAEADLDGKKSEEPRMAAKSVGGVSDILYNKGVHYLMTHDLDLGLPDPVFGGGRLKVSPKSIDEDGGVIVKINFEEPPKEEGRLYFKNLSEYFDSAYN